MSYSKILSTKDLKGMRVVGGKSGTKRIGKVRSFVFHPKERKCVGIIVKRPDFLWMFRRKDKFIALDGLEFEDGRILMPTDKTLLDDAACKRLGIDWDACVLWEGMPILTQSGKEYGQVGVIEFMRSSGKVVSIEATRGATAHALLGQTIIPAELIKGFKIGAGARLTLESEDADVFGAILVDDGVTEIKSEGGLADAAGKSAAVVADKVSRASAKAKPKVDAATKAAGEAVNKGAYATGRQIHRAKGMFSEFAKEYKKASKK